jgi:hypothetical protein
MNQRADRRPARTGLARALSLAGHPAVLMPAVVLFATRHAPADPAGLHPAVAAAVVGGCVVVYSLLQVRAGRWRHVDASVPRERRQLNLFLALLLFGVAGALWLRAASPSLVAGLALCGALVVFAHLLRRWLKVSLHTSFAVLAASFLWPDVAGTVVLLMLAAAVAWSRLELRRHTRAEVAAGWLAGAVAGAAFRLLAR